MSTSELQPGVKVKVLSPQGKLLEGYVVDRMNLTLKRGGEPVYVICRKKSDGSMLPPAHPSRIILDEEPAEPKVFRPQVFNSDTAEIARALDKAHEAARQAANRPASTASVAQSPTIASVATSAVVASPASQSPRPAISSQVPPLQRPEPQAVPVFQGEYPKVAAEASDNACGSSSVAARPEMEVNQPVAVCSATHQEAPQMDTNQSDTNIYQANAITETVTGVGDADVTPSDIDSPHDDEQLRRVERSPEDRTASIAAIIANDDEVENIPATAGNDDVELSPTRQSDADRDECEREEAERAEFERKKRERQQHVARVAEMIAADRVDSIPAKSPPKQREPAPTRREDDLESLELLAIERKIRARRQHIKRVAEIIAANRVRSIPIAGQVDRSKPQPADPYARRRIMHQRVIQRREEHLTQLAETIANNRVASVSVPKTKETPRRQALASNTGAVLTAVPTPYIDRLAKVCKLWRTESQRCVGGDVRSYGLLQPDFSTVYCFSTINGEISARDRRNLDQALAGNMIGRAVRDVQSQTDRLLRRGFVRYRK